MEEQEIILDWEAHLVTSLLQYLYTGQVRVPGQEEGERLEEMMVALEIVSRLCPADLKVEEEEAEIPPSVRPCYVGLENIKLQLENIQTEGETKEEIPTEREDQSTIKPSILLKPRLLCRKQSATVRKNFTSPAYSGEDIQEVSSSVSCTLQEVNLHADKTLLDSSKETRNSSVLTVERALLEREQCNTTLNNSILITPRSSPVASV